MSSKKISNLDIKIFERRFGKKSGQKYIFQRKKASFYGGKRYILQEKRVTLGEKRIISREKRVISGEKCDILGEKCDILSGKMCHFR